MIIRLATPSNSTSVRAADSGRWVNTNTDRPTNAVALEIIEQLDDRRQRHGMRSPPEEPISQVSGSPYPVA